MLIPGFGRVFINEGKTTDARDKTYKKVIFLAEYVSDFL